MSHIAVCIAHLCDARVQATPLTFSSLRGRGQARGYPPPRYCDRGGARSGAPPPRSRKRLPLYRAHARAREG